MGHGAIWSAPTALWLLAEPPRNPSLLLSCFSSYSRTRMVRVAETPVAMSVTVRVQGPGLSL